MATMSDTHAALLSSLGITEAHVYDAPCGCALATPRLPLAWHCGAHGQRWRYLVTHRLHRGDRAAWCGPVIDGCVVEKEVSDATDR